MRYRLRTLLIVLSLGPPVLACGWIHGRKAIDAYLKPPPASPETDQPWHTILTLPTFVFPSENQGGTTSEALFDPGGPPDNMVQDWRKVPATDNAP